MYHAKGVADPSGDELAQIKANTAQALRGTASAFLLDPTFGIPVITSLPVEGHGYGVLLDAEPGRARYDQRRASDPPGSGPECALGQGLGRHGTEVLRAAACRPQSRPR